MHFIKKVYRNYKIFINRGLSITRALPTLRSKVSNWPVIVLDAWGLLLSGRIYTLTFRGLPKSRISFRAGTYDQLIIAEIFGYEEYAKYFVEELDSYKKFMDIGGQTGVFSAYMLMSNVSIEGVAVEATTVNFNVLKKNIEQNAWDNRIRAIHAAAWSESGKLVTMNMSAHNTGGHSAVVSGVGRTIGEQVETLSLEDLVGENIYDLLKVDIEGAEYELLYTAPRDVFARIARIILEAHPIDNDKRNAKSLAEFLKSVGYSVSLDKRYIWATKSNV